MPNVTIEVLQNPEIEAILVPGEKLLWSGRPDFGRGFWQFVGPERVAVPSIVVGMCLMWASLWLIRVTKPETDILNPIYVFSAVTLIFCLVVLIIADFRQFVLKQSIYFVTNRRAIILRKGRNWHLATRLYVVSCAHSKTYPYQVVRANRYPSLIVGTLLSDDVVQPFGLGLSHPSLPIGYGVISSPVAMECLKDGDEVMDLILSCAT